MSGALLAVFQNQRSFIPPVPVVGSALGGGFFAGQISTAGNSIADYNLIVGPNASAYNASKQWKTSNTNSPGTFSIINGDANSTAMNDANHPAAQFCKSLTIGGFSDWYMPAINELEICYYNLKPTTGANSTGGPTYGYNGNSVPLRAGPYTSGIPAQTSASAFITGQAEAFNATVYWSSYQQTSARGWYLPFNNGRQYYTDKNYAKAVRAVRRVPV
jgi:hypothetical protein